MELPETEIEYSVISSVVDEICKKVQYHRKGTGIRKPYTFEDIKRIITTYTRLDIEPEMSLLFRDKQSKYMIIGYMGHVSFQRCGYKDGSGEINYSDLDALFSEELIDGICLKRD